MMDRARRACVATAAAALAGITGLGSAHAAPAMTSAAPTPVAPATTARNAAPAVGATAPNTSSTARSTATVPSGTSAVVAKATASPTRQPSAPKATGPTVPWSAKGFVADSGHVPYPNFTKPPRSKPGCRSADFELIFDRTSPAPSQGQFEHGWQLTVFTLRYDGRSACALSGQPFSGQLVTASGVELPNDRFIGGPAIADRLVRPGQLVFGSVGWAVKLGQEPRPAELVSTPPCRPLRPTLAWPRRCAVCR